MALWRAVWALGRAMQSMHARAGGLLCDAANDGLIRCRTMNVCVLVERTVVEKQWREQQLAHNLLRTVLLSRNGGFRCVEFASMYATKGVAFRAMHCASRALKDPDALMHVACFIAAFIDGDEGTAAMLKAKCALNSSV